MTSLLSILTLAISLSGVHGELSSNGTSDAPAPAEFTLDSYRWRAETTPQPVVRATNEWGDLRVRTSHRGSLVVGAMIQRRGPADLEIRIEEMEDAVIVEVLPLVPEPRGRIDLTVMVPPGKRVEGSTRDGLVEAKYGGDVVLRTRAGDVTLETSGRADVATESGDITARLSGEIPEASRSLVSGTGSVAVYSASRSAIASVERQPRR